MTDNVANAFAEIWKDDLFDRQTEAIQLEAYIESLAGRKSLREDKRAFTIAVEGGYGEGKSFFLRRFAEHLKVNHPVALVDAWADDLADEPLTALAATMKDALKPYLSTSDVQPRLKQFLRTTGKVAKIASLGVARRMATMAVGDTAVIGIEAVFDADLKKEFHNKAEALSSAIADSSDAALKDSKNTEIMETRIAEFEQGRSAVQEMKESLTAVLAALDGSGIHPPIIIIIDELDRCRPTYAVKLLEEIKHLFDVPGLVFILGINSKQLSHSVNGAYGSTFDGRSYLRRFIDREYRLNNPKLEILTEHLCREAGLKESRFFIPQAAKRDGGGINFPLPLAIASYMRIYGLRARDAYQLIDILQTSTALAGDIKLHLAYLAPLAIGRILGVEKGLPDQVHRGDYVYIQRKASDPRNPDYLNLVKVAEDFQNASIMPASNIHDSVQRGRQTLGISAIANSRDWETSELPLWDISRYEDLITAVGRFSNYAIDAKP